MNYTFWLLFCCTIWLCRLSIAQPRISARSVTISKQMINGKPRTVITEVEDNVDSVHQLITRTKKTKRQPVKMSKRAAARMKYKMDTGVAR